MLTLAETTSVPPVRSKVMISEDPLSRDVLRHVRRIAPSDAPVLVTGETGTGKELVARQLHAFSRRAARPFVAVNAGALSESLLDSELFGHEKGAFTGACAAKAGWFEAAHGGTLFLDEVGDLSLASQVKLLRVLQEGEIVRLGSRVPMRVDVRLIAATNVDLPAAIRARTFREDLFYRLRVTSITLPPLRDRPGDILALARYFVSLYERHLGKVGTELTASAVERLLQHSWPGNIRELENAIHNALLVCQESSISASDLQLAPSESERQIAAPEAACSAEPELARLEQVVLELLQKKMPDLHDRVEATLLAATYRYCGKNQLETARLLGMSRNVVRARLIEHGEIKGPLRRSVEPATIPQITPRSRGPWRQAPRDSIRVGIQKLGLLMLVKGFGGFDAALAGRGIGIDWVEYDGGVQIVEALRTCSLDVGVLGDCPAVLAQAEDVPIVYVAAEPPAPRGAALIVPECSPVRHVSDLRGRRVAVNRAAQAHYLLLKALEEAGLEQDDVDVCFEPPARALEAFRAGTIDAWAIWDPWLSSARIDFRARVLRDATGLLMNSAYYVARRDFAEQRPELVEELVMQLQAAALRAHRDPVRAAALVAPAVGLSPRAIAASFERELGTIPVGDDLIAAQQDIADTLLRLRLISRPVSVGDAQWRFELAG